MCVCMSCIIRELAQIFQQLSVCTHSASISPVLESCVSVFVSSRVEFQTGETAARGMEREVGVVNGPACSSSPLTSRSETHLSTAGSPLDQKVSHKHLELSEFL